LLNLKINNYNFNTISMGRFSFFCLSFILISFNLFSKNIDTTEFVPKGEPIVNFFSNFHTSITDDGNNSGFEMQRAYFGYKI